MRPQLGRQKEGPRNHNQFLRDSALSQTASHASRGVAQTDTSCTYWSPSPNRRANHIGQLLRGHRPRIVLILSGHNPIKERNQLLQNRRHILVAAHRENRASAAHAAVIRPVPPRAPAPTPDCEPYRSPPPAAPAIRRLRSSPQNTRLARQHCTSQSALESRPSTHTSPDAAVRRLSRAPPPHWPPDATRACASEMSSSCCSWPASVVFKIKSWRPIVVAKILANLNQSRTMLARNLGDHLLRLGFDHAAHHRHARLDDPRLLAGNRARACCRAASCGRS